MENKGQMKKTTNKKKKQSEKPEQTQGFKEFTDWVNREKITQYGKLQANLSK
jgi:hypothetical protein